MAIKRLSLFIADVKEKVFVASSSTEDIVDFFGYVSKQKGLNWKVKGNGESVQVSGSTSSGPYSFTVNLKTLNVSWNVKTGVDPIALVSKHLGKGSMTDIQFLDSKALNSAYRTFGLSNQMNKDFLMLGNDIRELLEAMDLLVEGLSTSKTGPQLKSAR